MAIVNFFLQNHKICIFKRNHPKTEVILFWSACLLFVIGFSNLFSLQGWLVTAGLLLLLFATAFRKQFSLSWGFWLLLIIGVAYNLATFLFDEWSYRYFVYFLAGPAIFYLFIKNSKQNQGILNLTMQSENNSYQQQTINNNVDICGSYNYFYNN